MKTLLPLVGLVGLSAAVHAATIQPFSSITGFSGGDSFTPQDFTPLTNGIGINKVDPNDPATWLNDTANYQNEWYDNDLIGAANGKLGWVSFDMGSSLTTLDTLYLINANAQGDLVATGTFNIYYANAPTVALPAPPGGNSAIDYDFASGGWTQLGGTRTLTTVAQSQAFDLSGISSARYIALELLTRAKVPPSNPRIGLDEAAITVIPEPSAVLLGSLGLLGLLRRRR